MGEGVGSDSLSEWLPADCDIYAVALQECMSVSAIRGSVQQLLGSAYEAHVVSIGSSASSLGYHGFIALILCVKVSEWS